MENNTGGHPNHLAWHETLELHELVASQAGGLMKLKNFIGKIKDPELRSIYEHTIKGLENNLHELLQFFPLAPRTEEQTDLRNLDSSFYASDLLAFAKTAVRSYAIAITETATPVVRETLNTQLQRAIETHGKIFYYMYKKGLYPAYNLEKLLQNDVKNANKALNMHY